MAEITTYTFSGESLSDIKKYQYGQDWPVVYILENETHAYVGETISAAARAKQHLDTEAKKHFNKMHIITDDEYNQSATHHIESSLIEYIAADGKYKVQNSNKGQYDHNYFDKEKYAAKFEYIWEQLKKISIVNKALSEIRNSDFFKFSPFKSLSQEQLHVVGKIVATIKKKERATIIISGKPGTGKTIIAMYLMKLLADEEWSKGMKVGLVVPMTSLRETLKKVFAKTFGLSPKMVLGPSHAVNANYDVLVVDESHRLHRRKNISNMGGHDKINRILGLGNEGTELNWVLMSAKYQVLFYDPNQAVNPSCVLKKDFDALPNATQLEISTQMRVAGGNEYIRFVDALLSEMPLPIGSFKNYDFRIFKDLQEMVELIREKEKEVELSRMVAGYAWKWASRDNPSAYDIEIGKVKLRWNSVTRGWVGSKNAINEVGCIHTVQGYDLNYAGVIIGPELSYDTQKKKIIVKKENYKDRNGHAGIEHPEELEGYVKNIYKTLLTRGMRGTYLYVCDESLRNFLIEECNAHTKSKQPKEKLPQPVPTFIAMVSVPLVGSAPCGAPLLGEENIESHIEVPKDKIKSGYKYFALTADGDSMNQAGIQDGDILLCRQQTKADTGDRVVVLLGGENVTIKKYGERINGVRLLLPVSTNPKHKPITPGEGDTVQGIVQEVIE